MTDNLRAPVQGYSAGIPWSLHLRAWDRYAEKYGRSQSAKRLAERGGFGVSELDVFVPGWRDEVSEITRLQKALAAAEAERDEARKKALEEAAAHARCAFDDRPRRDGIDWNDGFDDGTRAAAAAIRSLFALPQEQSK